MTATGCLHLVKAASFILGAGSHEVPSPHSSFSANRIQPIFTDFLLPPATSLPTRQLSWQVSDMGVVDPHFSAWPANTVEEERVHLEGGDHLLVSLKAALCK